MTPQLPSSASRQSRVMFFWTWPAQLGRVMFFFGRDLANSHVMFFWTVPCHVFLKQRACSEMHLQWDFTTICMMLAWPRSRVMFFFGHGQLGWAVS